MRPVAGTTDPVPWQRRAGSREQVDSCRRATRFPQRQDAEVSAGRSAKLASANHDGEVGARSSFLFRCDVSHVVATATMCENERRTVIASSHPTKLNTQRISS